MATVAPNPTAFGYSDDVESLETVQSILAHLDLADPTDGPSWQGGSPALSNLLSPQEVPGRLPTPTAFRPQPITRPLNGGSADSIHPLWLLSSRGPEWSVSPRGYGVGPPAVHVPTNLQNVAPTPALHSLTPSQPICFASQQGQASGSRVPSPGHTRTSPTSVPRTRPPRPPSLGTPTTLGGRSTPSQGRPFHGGGPQSRPTAGSANARVPLDPTGLPITVVKAPISPLRVILSSCDLAPTESPNRDGVAARHPTSSPPAAQLPPYGTRPLHG
jgi:hypothetical protein